MLVKLSNSKIENRAVDVLRNVIDNHYTMDHQFNAMDKEMSWDGYIWIYKDSDKKSQKTKYDDKVPVQIKGHIDEKEVYINKKIISYSVSLEDLEVYSMARGLIYFQIFMSQDNRKKAIFYTSLFPVKIKYYLKKAREKGNKKNINIVFTRLEPKPENMYSITKQFSNESRKQGFGCGQLEQNAIKEVDMYKVKEISASVVGATSEYDFLQRLGAGDACFYANIDGTPFQIPIEWHEGGLYCISKKIDAEIWMGGTKYYDSYNAYIDSKGNETISPSENVKIDLLTCKFIFDPKSGIKTLRNDAEFLLSVNKNSKINIGKHVFCYKDPQMPQCLYDNLQFYIETDEIFTKLGIEYENPVSVMSEEMRKSLAKLIILQSGKKNELFSEKVHTYNLMVGDKYAPLIIIRNDEGGKNEIRNAIYDSEYQMFVSDEKDNHYIVPKFSYISGKMARNLYKYDFSAIEKEIFSTVINAGTKNVLNMAGLNLIHAYDGNIEQNQQLLDMAGRLFEELSRLFVGELLYVLNWMQVKKRKNSLGREDMEILEKLQGINNQEVCAKYILLGKKKEATLYFKQMDESEQNIFKQYPIYTLYENL